MAKMFYTSEEVAHKLHITVDQIKEYVQQNKLREFRDGAKVMFKVDQVDRLASDSKGASKLGAPSVSDSGFGLAPVDSGKHDALSLADSDTKLPISDKDDTVMTGLNAKSPAASSSASATGKAMVFDDTEIKAADSGAQTQIQPAVEDQLSLESVGSGSGLLDLTRESDDTSLGAELLDEIYPGSDQKQEGGIGSASGIFDQPIGPDSVAGVSGLGMSNIPDSTPAAISAPVEVYEAADSSAGAFGGMALAAVLAMGVTLVILSAAYVGFSPAIVDTITEDTTKIALFGGILAVVAGLFAGVGFFAGKAGAR